VVGLGELELALNGVSELLDNLMDPGTTSYP
jgi:hypothetical protein